MAITPRTQPPEWNLSDLYAGIDDQKIAADLAEATSHATAFESEYAGQLNALDGRGFLSAITSYEALGERLSRVTSYAQLLFAANTGDPEVATFYQTINEQVTEISSKTLFFELEINRLDQERLNALIGEAGVDRYAPWLKTIVDQKPHQLADELEKLLHDKSVTGRSAWSRLFDETMSGLRFDVEGKSHTSSEVLNMMSDTDQEVRRVAASSFATGLAANSRLFGLITNTLAKDKEIEDRWRNYATPVSRRNLVNQVENEVVEALTTSVQSSYPQISHRYYTLKAKWLGVEKLPYWDRNAPLPAADDTRHSWTAAKQTVLDAYEGFAPDMEKIAATFFDRNWIDARPRDGKDSGAFSHPTVPSAHPYILMNFHGRIRDIMTLAHELGHGVHQVLAAPQGHFLSNTPLTLAETASVFGEMLTFRALLDGQPDEQSRRIMLASKVEDMINTVVRQTAFFEFEKRIHDERRSGEIAVERIGEIWMDVQRESLGPAFDLDDEYAIYWAYIPHFIHSPFYVYAYAFGDCLVNSLYDVFQSGHPGFQSKYLDMLRAGGTLRHKELLAPFDLDASDPAFWQRGLGVVSGFIDELEATF